MHSTLGVFVITIYSAVSSMVVSGGGGRETQQEPVSTQWDSMRTDTSVQTASVVGWEHTAHQVYHICREKTRTGQADRGDHEAEQKKKDLVRRNNRGLAPGVSLRGIQGEMPARQRCNNSRARRAGIKAFGDILPVNLSRVCMADREADEGG